MTEELPARRAIAVFAVFAFAYFLSTLIRAITATLAPTLVAELALDARDLGLLAGGYFLGFAATQLPLGQWLDKFGPRRMQMLLLSVAVLGSLAFSFSQSFWGLLIARMLTGVGVGACLMAPLTGYRRWFAADQQLRANSWMLTAGALGFVASTLPVQWLLPQFGWRPVFVGLAAMLALAALLIAWQVPAWERGAASASSAGYAEVWKHPQFRALAPIGFFNYGGLVALQTLWAGPWMTKVAGHSALSAAAALFWINVCMLCAYWLWGWANPRLERKGLTAQRLMVWGAPLPLVWLLLMAAAGPALGGATAWVIGLYCVCSTFVALAQPAVGLAFPSALAGRALSAFNMLIFCGIFCVQWGIGLLVDGLRALGCGEAPAFQLALAAFGLCCLASYLHFLRAKTP